MPVHTCTGDLHRLAERHLQSVGDLFHDLARQPAVRVLNLGQRMDQRARLAAVFLDDAVDPVVPFDYSFAHIVASVG
jgi:hypothetical protein